MALAEVVKANLEIDVEEEFRLAEERERERKAARPDGPSRLTTE